MRASIHFRGLATGALAGILLTGLVGYHFASPAPDLVDEIVPAGFSFTIERTAPGTPDEIYDALTGDISGWWDHTVARNPARLYIEATPGGGFYEIFNEAGDGVRHAVVTAAERGVMLRFEGPLGLAGNALHMVHTYELERVGAASTRIRVSVHAVGEVQEGWPEAVEGVWDHFVNEQFVPYMEAGGRAGD
jgi:hypothetical protein